MSHRRIERSRFASVLAEFHYLGYGGSVGENLQYTITHREDRLLGCALFGAGAWKCAGRDEFIGWNPEKRKRGLSRVAGNSRFLIAPWVRVPGLGSWILGALARRIAGDWRSAVIYTIIQRCRRMGINPQDYLTDVLKRLPSMKNNEVHQLLPSCWKPRPTEPPPPNRD